jgi:hypothetical protein
VIPRNRILSIARSAARTAAVGISIRVSIRNRSRRMWSLRVTGRRGRRRASATQGRAWFGRDRNRRPHYSAAGDQRARHRRIIRAIDSEIDRRAAQIMRDTTNPRRIHGRLEPHIRTAESRPRPRPLSGIRLDVKERRYALTSNRESLRYRYELGPNVEDGDMEAPIVPRYRRGRIRDTNHWLLRNARPPIRNLGPYVLIARRINANQEFAYSPSRNVWNRPNYQARRWLACVDSIQFQPERYTWNVGERRFTQHQNQRLARGRAQQMRRRVVDLLVASTDARVVHGLMSHNDARTRRPIRSLDAEERFGGHTVERHVLGHGIGGIQNVEDLARRAGWGEIVIQGRLGRSIIRRPGGRAPTAFLNLRNANLALSSARRELSILWRDMRTEFARKQRRNPSLVWDVDTPLVRGARARRIDRNFLRRAERPRYMGWRVHGGRAPNEGNRPLFRQHVTGVTPSNWNTWAAGNPAADPTAPVTELTFHVVRKARVVFRPSRNPAAKGFFLLTMYPTS